MSIFPSIYKLIFSILPGPPGRGTLLTPNILQQRIQMLDFGYAIFNALARGHANWISPEAPDFSWCNTQAAGHTTWALCQCLCQKAPSKQAPGQKTLSNDYYFTEQVAFWIHTLDTIMHTTERERVN